MTTEDIHPNILESIKEISVDDYKRVVRLVALYWASGDCKDAYDILKGELHKTEIHVLLNRYENLIVFMSQNLDDILEIFIDKIKGELK